MKLWQRPLQDTVVNTLSSWSKIPQQQHLSATFSSGAASHIGASLSPGAAPTTGAASSTDAASPTGAASPGKQRLQGPGPRSRNDSISVYRWCNLSTGAAFLQASLSSGTTSPTGASLLPASAPSTGASPCPYRQVQPLLQVHTNRQTGAASMRNYRLQSRMVPHSALIKLQTAIGFSLIKLQTIGFRLLSTKLYSIGVAIDLSSTTSDSLVSCTVELSR